MENYFGQVQGSLNLTSVARQGKEGKDTGQLYMSVYHVLSACVFVVRGRKREERSIRNTKESVKGQTSR